MATLSTTGLAKAKRPLTAVQKLANARKLNRAANQTLRNAGGSAGTASGTHLRTAARAQVMSALQLPGARTIKTLLPNKADQKVVKSAVNQVVRQTLNARAIAPTPLAVPIPPPAPAPAPTPPPQVIATPVDPTPAAAVDRAGTGTEAFPVDLSLDSQAEATAAPYDQIVTEEVVEEVFDDVPQYVEEYAETYEDPYASWDAYGEGVYGIAGGGGMYQGGYYGREYNSGVGNLGQVGFLKNILKKIPIVKNNVNTIGAVLGAVNPAAGAIYQAATATPGYAGPVTAPAPAPARAVAPAAPRPQTVVRRVAASTPAPTNKSLPGWVIPTAIGGGAVVVLGLLIVATRK